MEHLHFGSAQVLQFLDEVLILEGDMDLPPDEVRITGL